MIEFNSEKELEFWCDICDAKTVNSENKNQGKFFQQYGHEIITDTFNGYVGRHARIIFAICCDCLANGVTIAQKNN